ncbi:MAG: hypothetical protein KJ749_15135, partial [Planctomycetes bacterium]|nr:hypothetical protein [Planctomycetota bacterium]
MELVRFVGASPEAASVFDRAGGRPKSGRGCLRLTAGSPGDTVVISNDHAKNWYLKRDWRPYDLLMMAVHASRDDCRLDITIASGTGHERSA